MDRNPFISAAPHSTVGLTLGVFATVLLATVVAIGALFAQLDAVASTTVVAEAPAFADLVQAADADACGTHHALRLEPITPVDALVTNLALVETELIVLRDGEEPHAVMSADCVADPVGCLIVSANDDTSMPADAIGAEAVDKPMLPDPATLSMIERVVDEGRV